MIGWTIDYIKVLNPSLCCIKFRWKNILIPPKGPTQSEYANDWSGKKGDNEAVKCWNNISHVRNQMGKPSLSRTKKDVGITIVENKEVELVRCKFRMDGVSASLTKN